MLHTMRGGAFTGIAIHGGTIFAQTCDVTAVSDKVCVVFT
jgi:hypothetical protein